MSKRPKKPMSLQPVEKEKEFNITDSLTLHVQMPGGRQAHVGTKGLRIAAEGGGGAQRPSTSTRETKEKSGVVESLLEPGKETYKFEDLKMGEVIGEGTQAKVRKVKHTPTRQLLALKIITFGPSMTRKVLQTELSRCVGVDKHPNLVVSLEAFFKEGFLMVLMEFMAHGTLSDVSKKVVAKRSQIPEDVLSAIAAQILAGLNHLHTGGGTGDGLIHRDLKPSNLLVNAEGQVKISDFGVATFLSNQQKMAFTAVGSTAYMSPERVRGDGYTTASDIWAVGISLAEIALGYFPLTAGSTQSQALFELCCVIAEERAVVQWPENSNASPEFKDFVAQCMIQKPEERPTAQELMEHPFVKKHEEMKPDLCAYFKSIMS